jgi:uncharacterized protein
MLVLDTREPLAREAVSAIHRGDAEALKRLLGDHPDLATARLGNHPDGARGMSRTLLHVVTDWPGHFPNGAAAVAALASAGADVDARFTGRATPRPRCTWPRAAMTSRCWMPCSTPVPTSRRAGP